MIKPFFDKYFWKPQEALNKWIGRDMIEERPKTHKKNDDILSLHKYLALFLQKDLSRSFLMVHTILRVP